MNRCLVQTKKFHWISHVLLTVLKVLKMMFHPCPLWRKFSLVVKMGKNRNNSAVSNRAIWAVFTVKYGEKNECTQIGKITINRMWISLIQYNMGHQPKIVYNKFAKTKRNSAASLILKALKIARQTISSYLINWTHFPIVLNNLGTIQLLLKFHRFWLIKIRHLLRLLTWLLCMLMKLFWCKKSQIAP